jgi:hypothetical protein
LEDPRIYSRLRMSAVAGALIGGALLIPLGWLISRIDTLLSMRICFGLVGGFSILGLVISLRMVETRSLALRYTGEHRRGFAAHLALTLIFGLGVGIYGPMVIPILMHTFHLSPYEAAVLYSPAVLSWYLGTRLAKPSPVQIAVGSILSSTSLYLMYVSGSVYMFLASWYLEGMGYSIVATSLDQYVSRLTRGVTWGSSYGIYNSVYNAAYTLGALMSGNLVVKSLLAASALMILMAPGSLLLNQRSTSGH